SVPAAWPVVDLRSDPGACARADVHAVYLGHQAAAAQCPARLRGVTESVQLQPLDDRVDAAARLATRSQTINGNSVRVDPASATTHRLVVADDAAGVLVTVTYRVDPALATRIVDSLTVTGARPSTVPAAPASPAGRPALATAAPRGA